MAQYIDKSALVAEIMKRRDVALTRQHNLESIGQESVLNEMIANELNLIISLINTLEVKEVDINEEAKRKRPMSKAEERALERFPVHKGASEEWIEMHLKGFCAEYIEGYHQAEKDLELTWEDIKTIDKLLNQCVDCNNPYQEVLKRFKDFKERKEI